MRLGPGPETVGPGARAFGSDLNLELEKVTRALTDSGLNLNLKR